MARIRTTKVQIPAQRGRGRRGAPAAHVVDLGRGTAPVVLVVPRQQSLSGRLALATGRALWRRRITWAPVWAGIGLFGATGLLSATAPAAALSFAVPAVLLPAGWVLVKRRHPRSAVRRRARSLSRHTAAVSAGLGWSAAAVWFGPAGVVLTLLWLAGTATAQILWSRHRRALATTPLTAPIVQD
ncbi:hypothetical protein J5Y04_28550 [Kitasatospora sp. RG8]|uniref:hypothetical protein n=1 Tax=Kitasatospora sp. RG8 TaxID=2820815 RepID=UPI001AE0807C|nr:hypothetical protein [Kitasatospora sp. RG8]MBP0453466.1 hypothetical protein [Kitasatospora sp. RG8]